MKCFWLVAAVWPLLSFAASAAPDCSTPPVVEAPLDGAVQEVEQVEEYRVVLRACHRAGSQDMLAVRTFRVEDETLLLAVDPQGLTTRLERAACWTCSDDTASLSQSRYLQAVEAAAATTGRVLAPGASWLDNAGLARGRGGGAFLTGDLCPSRQALDRGFLQSLEQAGAATPIALSMSGGWLVRHAEDFAWLRRQKAEGRLAITFVNHSYRHPYRPGLPDGENYLLMAGHDPASEVLDLERLLIANGETPSVFFRFPGLISDRAWMEALRRDHLIALGAESWLANNQAARPGGVLLVHVNGNEPFGLDVFDRLRRQRRLPQPLRPLTEAP